VKTGIQKSERSTLSANRSPLIAFRPYQAEIFNDRQAGILLMPWGRQVGKSFTLAAWAVDRLLTRPGRLVTILSNSRDNGQELNLKCREVCEKLGAAFEPADLSPDVTYENMNMETRVTVAGKTGRVKVLAANPRTARGFSGDLILDEFDWQEDQRGIWEAAEPILSSNPDYLCRIATTLNGRRMMWEMMHSGLYKVVAIRRSDAFKQGLKIYHPVTRKEITPDEARSVALDKRAYDQNYENIPGDSTLVLLTHELIDAATDNDCGIICDQEWSSYSNAPAAPKITSFSDFLLLGKGDLYVGADVGRSRDLTVIAVLEKISRELFFRGILRIQNTRLPDQQARLEWIIGNKRFRRACIDMTGIGLGLVEYTQKKFGTSRILGINFASTVPMPGNIAAEGRKRETVRITEFMAMNLLQAHEDKRIHYPCDPQMRDDLRKPERIVSPSGRVSIAAARTESGHADHFWALAMAIHAAGKSSGPFQYQSVSNPRSMSVCGSRSRRGVLM